MARPIGSELAITRVRRQLAPDGECLVFQGLCNHAGYGRVSRSKFDPGTSLTHRIVWEAERGPAPAGLVVMHSCDNPPCCNLEHLSLGTRADNSADMKAKGRAPASVGMRNGKTKIDDDKVAEIRSAVAAGATKAELGRRFGLHPSHVGRIASGQRRPGAS